jgi:surfactin synthase thioesterase subunit
MPRKARETLRLFCFPHAGGGPAMFNAWSRALGPRIEVVPVEVANRERFVPLPCPIYAFGGSDDPLVSEPDLHEWRSRTTGEFSVQIHRGGHFYLSDGPQLFAALRRQLSRIGGTQC